MDNYFIGTKANITHLLDNPRFKLYEQDLADFAAVNEIFRAEQVDYVFHLAANSDIQASANDPAMNITTPTPPRSPCWRPCGSTA